FHSTSPWEKAGPRQQRLVVALVSTLHVLHSRVKNTGQTGVSVAPHRNARRPLWPMIALSALDLAPITQGSDAGQSPRNSDGQANSRSGSPPGENGAPSISSTS